MAWQYALLGHRVVTCTALDKPYDFLVILVQVVVLIQFEQLDTRLTLPTLMQRVGVEDRDEMERTLQSLASGKEGTRILRQIPFDAGGAEGGGGKPKKMRLKVDETAICLRSTANLTARLRRIRIANILMKETKEERDKTVEV